MPRPLGDDLFSTYLCATAIRPQGSSIFKRGVRSVEAAVRFSEPESPVIAVQAYRDGQGAPCVRIRARLAGVGRERLFYEGPLSAETVFPPDPNPGNPAADRSADPTSDDYDCPDCQDLGWAIFNDCPETGDLGEIQACDCGFFPSDDEALAAARAAGLSVDDDYQVLFVP
jgi:hypothetical protein